MADEWSQSKTDRATDLWLRLLGCFGESLVRRFGETPPEEWRGAVGQLSEYQLQRGMRRALGSGKTTAPSLPEFLSWCRTVGQTDGVPDDAAPTDRLVLPGPVQDDGFDNWACAANRHLFGHIFRAACERRYLTSGLRALLDAKNSWAADMRDIAQNGAVPVDVQRAAWDDYIAVAEKLVEWKQAA